MNTWYSIVNSRWQWHRWKNMELMLKHLVIIIKKGGDWLRYAITLRYCNVMLKKKNSPFQGHMMDWGWTQTGGGKTPPAVQSAEARWHHLQTEETMLTCSLKPCNVISQNMCFCLFECVVWLISDRLWCQVDLRDELNANLILQYMCATERVMCV